MNKIEFRNPNSTPSVKTGLVVNRWVERTFPSAVRSRVEPLNRSNSKPLTKRPTQGASKRESEFAAGRSCAHGILSSFGEFQEVGVAQDRSPVWPTGFVGSISHSNLWAWSVVARNSELRSIGIDTEIVVKPKSRELLSNEILTDKEWQVVSDQTNGLDPETLFTLVFSAKESFYKCWYPVTKAFFGFDDVSVVAVDDEKLKIQLLPGNPNYEHQPRELEVYYSIENQNVFTATWMEQQA